MTLVQIAVRLHHFNEHDATNGLKVEPIVVPEPQDTEVRVRMTLRPINPSDIMSLQGLYEGFKPAKFPCVPGLEGTGTVEKLGLNVSRVKVGDRVIGAPWPAARGNGTWQEYVVVPESCLVVVPDKCTVEAAAQAFVNPVTAYGFFDVLQIPKGEYLLQTAANSALGRQVIELAKKKGVKTIDVVRRSEAKNELYELGADVVIALDKESMKEEVSKVTGGRGAYAGIDPVSGGMTGQVLMATRYGGTVRVYGALTSFDAIVNVSDLMFKEKQLLGFWLSSWLSAKPKEEQYKVVQEVLDLLADGVMTAATGKHEPLEKAPDAVRESMKPNRKGKVFLEG